MKIPLQVVAIIAVVAACLGGGAGYLIGARDTASPYGPWPKTFDEKYDMVLTAMLNMTSEEREAVLIEMRENHEIWTHRSEALQQLLDRIKAEKKVKAEKAPATNR